MAVQTEHSLRLGVEIKKKLKEFDLDVSFDAGKGCLGILGPSGCGKSMTLKSIAGIITPDSGRIAIQYAKGEAAGGRVLYDSALKINEKPQMRRVGYLFQNYALFPNMSVEENIAAGLKGLAAKQAIGGRKPSAQSPAAIRAKVGEMLERFRLAGLEKRYPGQLSGGQQQRVSAGRALINDPAFILADEPTGNLDSRSGREVIELLMAANRKSGQTLILITHDENIALQANRILTISDGRIIRDEVIRG